MDLDGRHLNESEISSVESTFSKFMANEANHLDLTDKDGGKVPKSKHKSQKKSTLRIKLESRKFSEKLGCIGSEQ